MVMRRTEIRRLSVLLCSASILLPTLAAAQPAGSVKQYEDEALRQYRAQKAQADAERRAEVARETQQRATAQREQRQLDQQAADARFKSQTAALCEEAVSREEWNVADHNCKIASDAGDVHATYRLGELTANGYGVPSDPVAGFNLIVRAARLGNADAHFSVCSMMRGGFGTNRSPSDAATCLSSLIKSHPDESIRRKAEAYLNDIYVKGEAEPPIPAVPSQMIPNDFGSTLQQYIAANTQQIGWGLDMNVALHMVVGSDGTVQGCAVEPPDNEALNEVACQAAKQALRFKPALDATARPIASLSSLPFRVQTVTKACADFASQRRGSRDWVGGLLTALACKSGNQASSSQSSSTRRTIDLAPDR